MALLDELLSGHGFIHNSKKESPNITFCSRTDAITEVKIALSRLGYGEAMIDSQSSNSVIVTFRCKSVMKKCEGKANALYCVHCNKDYQAIRKGDYKKKQNFWMIEKRRRKNL